MAIGYSPQRVSTLTKSHRSGRAARWPLDCRAHRKPSLGTRNFEPMTHVLTHAGRRCRLRALALLAVLIGACNSTDNLTNSDAPEGTSDGLASDSLSLASDSLAVAPLSTPALSAELYLYASRGQAYGPEGLWADYTSLKSSLPFTASTNFTDPNGIVKQISAARNKGQRLILNMTGGSHSRYKTNGRFDYSKWKAVMNQFNTRAIKSAVAAGVSDGTVIMNTVMDEPSVKDWGGVMTKPLLDKMATYAKSIFPTLPAGVALRYDWRTFEKFHVMDAYISQYSWYKGTVASFRDKGVAEAKRQGMKMVFAMNLINGGQLKWSSWYCPQPLTGGRGSYYPACRMSASNVRDWGKVLGPAGCGLVMWKYESTFMSKSANITALKDLAAYMRNTSGRPCRRSS
jgi:hypothetical protein